MKFSVVGNSI